MSQVQKPGQGNGYYDKSIYSKKQTEPESSYETEDYDSSEESYEASSVDYQDGLYEYSPTDILNEYVAAKSNNPYASSMVLNGQVYSISMVEQYLASLNMLPQQHMQGGNAKMATAQSGTMPPPSKYMSSGQTPAYQQAQSMAQQMQQQGYPPNTIYNKLIQTYGNSEGVSQADLMYFSKGMGEYNPYQNNPQYAAYTKQYSDNSGMYDPYAQAQMDAFNNMQTDQFSKQQISKMKKEVQNQKVKMHMIMLQILMGDIVGAMRSYAILADRDFRAFTRTLVKKLEKIREAKGVVMRDFGRIRQVKPYVGQNAEMQARNTQRQQKTTQLITVTTQLIGEIQNTERECLDALQTMNQWNRQFWESYASLRDSYWRTTDRVINKN